MQNTTFSNMLTPLQPPGWNTEMIVLIGFGLAFLIQLFYYGMFFLRLAFWRKPDKIRNLPPVSVIICAKNEAKNIQQHLPAILEQDYPNYQVVVVNDGSWDGTKEVLQRFEAEAPHLHVIHIKDSPRDKFSKKRALTLGIKEAMHEHLVLTDADCFPAGNQWLQGMAGGFSSETSLILGYGPYARRKGLLNALIRFDTFYIALQYLSFGKAGIPYMGVGRNLAYTKTLFYSVGGFKSNDHIASGDDDLLVNQAGNRNNTRMALSQDAHTISQPETTWKNWWRQKKRHLTTAHHYRFIHKFLLTLYPFSIISFNAGFVYLLIRESWTWTILIAYLVRLLLQFVIFRRIMRYLGQQDLLLLTPVFELFFLVFNLLVYGSNLIAKPKKRR